MSRRLICLLALSLLTGCSRCNKVKPGPGPDEPTLQTSNGLEGADRAAWHHLAEGSELYPLAWLLALEDPDTGKPFLDNPGRFGLLADARAPGNEYGLPVGLTADSTRDLRFAGVQMVGVNCAGCHVNELHYKGQPVVRIDGAPNLFDLELFLGKLAEATKKTFTSPELAWRFAVRLYEISSEAEAPQAGAAPAAAPARPARPADDVLRSYKTLSAMREGALGKRLAPEVEAVYKQERARPVVDLNKGIVTRLPNNAAPALSDYAKGLKGAAGARRLKYTKDLRDAARDVRARVMGAAAPPRDVANVVAVEPTRPSALKSLSVAARTTSVLDALAHFGEVVRLLQARAAFLQGLLSPVEKTDPGFGRVDAFGSARNRFFPAAARPKHSPISYPHLWGLAQVPYLHWDANTTSVLERNAGQAIGLGAVFDADTFESTLLVDNLNELERLALKITPPAWPVKAFGAIDTARAARGKDLFAKHCLECHNPAVGANGKTADLRFDLDKIGTDDVRALSFDSNVGARPFADALSEALKKLVRTAGGTTPNENLWRGTRQYPGRPLRAIWATAPYLHNNSVPTLYDLLLPADQRPKKFFVGSREYDPVKLGYSTEKGTPFFELDTSRRGNSNAGHAGPRYGTDAMNHEQRLDLLEYLKTQ